MPRNQYTVHLVSYDDEFDAPVTGERIDWFDTGLWLDAPEGRYFFPYEQVRAVQEQDAEAAEPDEADEEAPTAEPGEVIEE